MMIRVSLIIGVFAVTNAIRVPPSWHEEDRIDGRKIVDYNGNRRIELHGNPANGYSNLPYVVRGDLVRRKRPKKVLKPIKKIKLSDKSTNRYSHELSNLDPSRDWIPLTEIQNKQSTRNTAKRYKPQNKQYVYQNAKQVPIMQYTKPKTDKKKYVREDEHTKDILTLADTKIPANHKPYYEFDENFNPIVKNIQYYKNTRKEIPPQEQTRRDYILAVRNKNHRDDDTHEKVESDDHGEESPEVEREEDERAPISDHEVPLDVPTKPIYPGEGQWAKKGLKHKPFISNHKFTDLENDEDDEKPDGFDVFEKGNKIFGKQNEKFEQGFSQLMKSQENFGQHSETHEKDNQNADNSEDDEEVEQEFVPMQIYSQVRKTENEEHLPPEYENYQPLREVIKDSKIQTVYTEEGYEDVAYDHAGHEKEAEEDEGSVEFDKNEEEEQLKRAPKLRYQLDEHDEDQDREESSYKKQLPENSVSHKETVKPRKNKVNNFHKTESTKTTAVKERDNGDMEILSEVKVVVAPNNDTKSHKYVKIFPKTFEYKESDSNKINNDETINSNSSSGEDYWNYTNNENKFPEFTTISSNENLHDYEDDNGKVEAIDIKTEAENNFNNDTDFWDRVNKYEEEYFPAFSIENKSNLDETNNSNEHKEENENNTPDFWDSTTSGYKETYFPVTSLSLENVDIDEKEKYNDYEDLGSTSTNQNANNSKNNTDFWDYATSNYKDEYFPTASTYTEQAEVITVTDQTTTENSPSVLKDLQKNYLQVLEIDTDLDQTTPGISNALGYFASPESFFALKRRKRFTLDLPKIEADTDFIHNIKDIEQDKEKDYIREKYPYYYVKPAKEMNPNSPIRYAESLDNIPQKTEGRMVFYEQADKTVCPEVETDIDPIPERVKNAEENADENNESSDVEDLAPSPRLGNLGDKIKCFKRKYFGENPLDSPFFKEEIIDQVTPPYKMAVITKPINYDRNTKENEVDTHDRENLSDRNLKNDNIKNNTKDGQLSLTEIPEIEAEVIPVTKQPEITTPSILSIITTPKYTIDLKPKHIYDQIELLHYLPSFPNSTSSSTSTSNKQANTIDNIKRLVLLKENSTGSNIRQGKALTEDAHLDTTYLQPLELVQSTSGPSKEENITAEGSSTDSQVDDNSPETIPQSLPLRKRKRRRKLKGERPIRYQVFDVNRFLPKTTPFPYFLRPVISTVLPKYKVFSEVHYKDEIKPNEQLAVFTDVLNIIKNSSNQEALLAAESQYGILSALPKENRIRTPRYPYYASNSNSFFDNDFANFQKNFFLTSSTTTTTAAPKTSVKVRGIYKVPKIKYQDVIPVRLNIGEEAEEEGNLDEKREIEIYANKELEKININDQESENSDNEASPSENEEGKTQFEEETVEGAVTEVFGLVPPSHNQYSTIHKIKSFMKELDLDDKIPNHKHSSVYTTKYKDPSLVYSVTDEKYPQLHKPKSVQKDSSKTYDLEDLPVNIFYVEGMKPPPKNQNILLPYMQKNNNFRRPNKWRRYKRSAINSGYKQLMRSRGPQYEGHEESEVSDEDDNDDDDYVPHRPRNYHYDVKSKRIVYDNPTTKEEYEDDEDTEEIIEDNVTERTTQSKVEVSTKSWIELAKATKDKPSLLFFVSQLKNHPNYTDIPDPTKAPKNGTDGVPVATSTSQPVSTTPPAFLSILAKVKTDSSYKIIEDKKETTAPSIKTESIKIEEEEDDDDDDDEDTDTKTYHNLKIFDISQYLPKARAYQTRPPIDYSKYKTIQRTSAAAPVSSSAAAPSSSSAASTSTTSTTRHNLSSRYNSDVDKVHEVNTKRVPIILRHNRNRTNPHVSESQVKEKQIEDPPVVTTPIQNIISTTKKFLTTIFPDLTPTSSSDSIVTHTTPFIIKATTEPVTQKRTVTTRRSRGRVRATVPKLQTTLSPQSSQITRRTGDGTHNVRRTYPRRKHVRIRLNHTEPSEDKPEIIYEAQSSVIRRKHEVKESPNSNETPNDDEKEGNSQKSIVPDYEDYTTDTLDEPLDIELFIKHDASEVHQNDKNEEKAPELEPEEHKKEKIKDASKSQSIKKLDVEVFSDYDKNKKHGGNYRREHSVETKQVPVKNAARDEIQKSLNYYRDSKLPHNVNRLKETEAPDNHEESEEHVDYDDHSQTDQDDDDHVEINFKTERPTTKKPFVLKEPGERLYFYVKV